MRGQNDTAICKRQKTGVGRARHAGWQRRYDFCRIHRAICIEGLHTVANRCKIAVQLFIGDGDGPIAKYRKWFSQFYAA